MLGSSRLPMRILVVLEMRACMVRKACYSSCLMVPFFFFKAEDGIRDWSVTGVQTCALPISSGGSAEIFGLMPSKDREQAADATTDWAEKAPTLLKLTSGTTAAPRAIRFGSQQLLADCNQI